MKVYLDATAGYNNDQLIYDAIYKTVKSDDLVVTKSRKTDFDDIITAMCDRLGISHQPLDYPWQDADIIIEFIEDLNKYIVTEVSERS